jgi:transcriptional regulator with XRE-family HTH domain
MTGRDEVRQLLLGKGMRSSDIMKAMSGRLSPNSVRKYISEALRSLDAAAIKALRLEQGKSAATSRGRAFIDRKSISQTHIRIGSKLAWFRTQEGMEPQVFANHHKFSNRIAIRAMEQGIHDFTLSELQRIAEILGVTLSELTEPMKP